MVRFVLVGLACEPSKGADHQRLQPTTMTIGGYCGCADGFGIVLHGYQLG